MLSIFLSTSHRNLTNNTYIHIHTQSIRTGTKKKNSQQSKIILFQHRKSTGKLLEVQVLYFSKVAALNICKGKSILFQYAVKIHLESIILKNIIYNSSNNHIVPSNKSKERYARLLWGKEKHNTSLKDIRDLNSQKDAICSWMEDTITKC